MFFCANSTNFSTSNKAMSFFFSYFLAFFARFSNNSFVFSHSLASFRVFAYASLCFQ